MKIIFEFFVSIALFIFHWPQYFNINAKLEYCF